MASANKRKTAFIAQKLEFFKEQREQLNHAMRLYVDGVIEAGESWTEEGDNQLRFLELCQKLDTAVEFMCEKCEELSVKSLDVAANGISGPPGEQSTLTAQSTVEQALATSSTQHLEPVHPSQESRLQPFADRIAVVEETLRSFQIQAEEVAEQQSDIKKQLTELLSNISGADKKHNSRYKQVKKQISEIIDRRTDLDLEHEEKIESLEKKLQIVSTAQERMETEVTSWAEMAEKLVLVPNQLESVKENLEELDTRIDRISDDCNNNNKSIENVTRDLKEKFLVHTQTMKLISEGHVKETNLLEDLGTRLQTLEAESGRHFNDVQNLTEKGEANLGILCQMINNRLLPLEQLRTCLNQRASARDENVKKLTQLMQQLAAISPRLQQLELKCCRTKCGFTALTSVSAEFSGSVIRPYRTAHSDVGKNFHTSSGIFTAPVDGVYVTAVSLYLLENNEMEVVVKYNKKGQDQSSSTFVCAISAEVKGTNACSVRIVDMKAGDMLFTYVYPDKVTVYEKIVSFSCFLLT